MTTSLVLYVKTELAVLVLELVHLQIPPQLFDHAMVLCPATRLDIMGTSGPLSTRATTKRPVLGLEVMGQLDLLSTLAWDQNLALVLLVQISTVMKGQLALLSTPVMEQRPAIMLLLLADLLRRLITLVWETRHVNLLQGVEVLVLGPL